MRGTSGRVTPTDYIGNIGLGKIFQKNQQKPLYIRCRGDIIGKLSEKTGKQS